MRMHLDKLDESGRSLCYSCRYYDWGIVIEKGYEGAWEHVCTSPGEHKPGDCVMMCEGYRKESNE